jgi:hypothetical protein
MKRTKLPEDVTLPEKLFVWGTLGLLAYLLLRVR